MLLSLLLFKSALLVCLILFCSFVGVFFDPFGRPIFMLILLILSILKVLRVACKFIGSHVCVFSLILYYE
jgi:hypothetical protein